MRHDVGRGAATIASAAIALKPGARAGSRTAGVFAAAGPIALIGGWTLAAGLQPAGYSAARQTISALAAHGARDRAVMTVALAVLGASYLGSATALPGARSIGRLVLALGGFATLAVAAFPQPEHGTSAAHTVAATMGFVTLALWPVFAGRPAATGPLSRTASILATSVLLGLLLWFGLALGGPDVGLAERVLAGAESLWPLVVAVGAARRG